MALPPASGVPQSYAKSLRTRGPDVNQWFMEHVCSQEGEELSNVFAAMRKAVGKKDGAIPSVCNKTCSEKINALPFFQHEFIHSYNGPVI